MKKKDDIKKRDIEITRQLAKQVEEKKNNEIKLKEENKRYVKMVLDQDEREKQV